MQTFWCLWSTFFRALTRRLQDLNATAVNGLAWVTNALGLFFAWVFFPLERPTWRAVRERRAALYPQINWSARRPLDPLRIAIQTVALLFLRLPKSIFVVTTRRRRGEVIAPVVSSWAKLMQTLEGLWERYVASPLERTLSPLVDRFTAYLGAQQDKVRTSADGERSSVTPASGLSAPVRYALTAAIILLTLIAITQPFTLSSQLVFVAISLAFTFAIRRVRSHFTMLIMIAFSIVVSSRYLYWRMTETMNFDTVASGVCGVLLLIAELYAFVVMVLSYFQVFWVLERRPVPMPADVDAWPHVDILIPTYNEPLDVIRPTVLAAQRMDWPAEKLHIWILDDGSRDEFSAFAKAAGVGCVRRAVHDHAKAGNINHALKQMSGDFVAIFDCDHVPVRSFLQMTIGWMVKDPSIALVQTPHHFYSQDPFARNLGLDATIPDDNALFHDFIQKGNDAWDATMFCGSCAVMRRRALDEVGGIAVETVTEDAHTSLKLNRRGWRSAFLGVPLAAGLSTETLSAHVGQRIRWARGMIQIFRLDNPLFGKGLTWGQRLCFFNAMIHFLHGLPRLIFLLAPLPYLFFGAYVFDAPITMILAFAIPHMLHATLTTGLLQRGYRSPFLGSLYEAVLAWYILLPTTVALINPKLGKFNVTVKGGTVASQYLDWQIIRPYLVLIALNAIGLVVGLGLIVAHPERELFTLINIGWILYNLVILGATCAVAVETVQERRYPRVPINRKAQVRLPDARLVLATLRDYSQAGANVTLSAVAAPALHVGDAIELVLEHDDELLAFPARVRRATVKDDVLTLGLALDDLTLEKERDLVAATFGRADAWAKTPVGPRNPFAGSLSLLRFAWRGYRAMAVFAPGLWGPVFRVVIGFLRWVTSFLPHRVRDVNAAPTGIGRQEPTVNP